ncbi:MAG: hypothetical protein KDB22_02065 [Planctomycetales bacterium]|nr:hypothetical protein [Planctomycetales bacterium]
MLSAITTLLIIAPITLHQLFDRAVSSRAELTSFELDFTCTQNLNQQSNDNVYEISSEVNTVGSVRFDHLSGVVLVRQKDELIKLDGKPQSFIDEYRADFNSGNKVRYITETEEYIWEPNSQTMVRKPRDAPPSYLELPFYLHAYGLGCLHDIRSLSPLEQILHDLKQVHPDVELKVDSEGIAHFDTNLSHFAFATKQGYWPIRQTQWKLVSSDPLKYEVWEGCEMQLVDVDKCWVPSKVKLTNGKSVTRFDFEWISVNKTVDPETIDVRAIESELRVEIAKEVEEKARESERNLRRENKTPRSNK